MSERDIINRVTSEQHTVKRVIYVVESSGDTGFDAEVELENGADWVLNFPTWEQAANCAGMEISIATFK